MIETFELRRRLDGDGRLIQAHHKVFRFPGGESHINFEPTSHVQIAYLHGANGSDIIDLAMWADAIKRTRAKTRGDYTTIACIPYLPGARADRGTPLGAKVYANMINSMGIDHVVAVDPHSDVAPALYDRLTVLSAIDVMPAMDEIHCVIAPDIGATKRAEAAAAYYDVEFVQATKHRDFKTGKLSGFSCGKLPSSNVKALLVDDICDGGGTFMGLAEAIRDNRFLGGLTLELWVTHGIFSNGAIPKLSKHFDKIHTTDSIVSGEGNPLVTVTPLLDKMVEAAIGKVN